MNEKFGKTCCSTIKHVNITYNVNVNITYTHLSVLHANMMQCAFETGCFEISK